jgi:hypothetical protein
MDGNIKLNVKEKIKDKIKDKIIDESIDEFIDDVKNNNNNEDDKEGVIRRLQKIWEPGLLDDYQKWRDFTFVIQNEFDGDDGLTIWGEICKLYTGYDTMKNLKKWVEISNKKMKKNEMLKIGTLHKWAKDYDEDTWREEFNYKKKVIPDSFECNAEEFEKKHAKIISKSFYIKQTDNGQVLMNEGQIKISYSHMTYKFFDLKSGIVLDRNFISNWIKNNPTQRRYEDINCHP